MGQNANFWKFWTVHYNFAMLFHNLKEYNRYKNSIDHGWSLAVCRP